MEQFSTLREKVQVLETLTATLMYQYDGVPKTAMDSKKHHVGGRELALVFFRRAFSEEKRNDRVICARSSHDADAKCCLRPRNRNVSSTPHVSCRTLFSSTKNRCVLGFKYARIDRFYYVYYNLKKFTDERILQYVSLGHSKRD